jgi:hypothetical protein
MTNTSTLKNDIIRFVYSETSISENEIIMQKLILNDDLYEFYMDCASTKETIDSIKYEPSEKCISNILNYSRSVV